MVERDPIDDLRALWQRLDAPEPDHSDAELDARDERADAAVAWMRAAYERLEAPVPELPWSLRRRRVVRGALALAAAAVVLVGTLVALTNGRDDARDAHDSGPLVADGTPAIASSRAALESAMDDPRVVRVIESDTTNSDTTNTIRTDVDDEGRVVMRHGSVDLVWIAPNESPFAEPQHSERVPDENVDENITDER